jgi:hypothetical protein
MSPAAHGVELRESSGLVEENIKSVCMQPKLSWGDRAENDDEGLPPPLGRVELQEALNEVVCSDNEFHVEGSEQKQSGLLPLFTPAAGTEVSVHQAKLNQFGSSPTSPTKSVDLSFVSDVAPRWREATHVCPASPIGLGEMDHAISPCWCGLELEAVKVTN